MGQAAKKEKDGGKMNILVINSGSSSLKFQLIDADTEELIAKGLCERIGIDASQISFTPAGGAKQKKQNSFLFYYFVIIA